MIKKKSRKSTLRFLFSLHSKTWWTWTAWVCDTPINLSLLYFSCTVRVFIFSSKICIDFNL